MVNFHAPERGRVLKRSHIMGEFVNILSYPSRVWDCGKHRFPSIPRPRGCGIVGSLAFHQFHAPEKVGMWETRESVFSIISTATKEGDTMDEALFEVLEIISEKAAEIMDECTIRFEGVREWEKNGTPSTSKSNGYGNAYEKPNGGSKQSKPRGNGTKRTRLLVAPKCREKRRNSLCGSVRPTERRGTR